MCSHAGMEYVKVVLQNGLMVGAVLIGDTDLEVPEHTYIHAYTYRHVNGLYHFSSNCCLCVCTLHAYLPTFVAGDV